MAGIGIAGGVGHFEDPSYFSEPEFDSEYQHQHIHKSKVSDFIQNIDLFLTLSVDTLSVTMFINTKLYKRYKNA